MNFNAPNAVVRHTVAAQFANVSPMTYGVSIGSISAALHLIHLDLARLCALDLRKDQRHDAVFQ
jgi:hypothetical protein